MYDVWCTMYVFLIASSYLICVVVCLLSHVFSNLFGLRKQEWREVCLGSGQLQSARLSPAITTNLKRWNVRSSINRRIISTLPRRQWRLLAGLIQHVLMLLQTALSPLFQSRIRLETRVCMLVLSFVCGKLLLAVPSGQLAILNFPSTTISILVDIYIPICTTLFSWYMWTNICSACQHNVGSMLIFSIGT